MQNTIEIERSEVINEIIHKYNLINPNYLEIGVHNGDTFKYVQSANRDGVDPGQYNSSCIYVNYRITSDEFFKHHISKKYDIIFIDGLHTAYQVSKDIYNSLNHLNDGGWIVLDDVCPRFEFEQGVLDLRKENCPQTGDVWKAICHILDIILDISDIIYFVPYIFCGKGMLVFKVKPGNIKNITIDETIPTCNPEGYYSGEDAEWTKYIYTRDFPKFLERLEQLIRK